MAGLNLFSEFACNGSLYAYLQNPDNHLDFEQILKWAKEIALGKYLFSHKKCLFITSCQQLQVVSSVE